jgi:hypothetical protein
MGEAQFGGDLYRTGTISAGGPRGYPACRTGYAACFWAAAAGAPQHFLYFAPERQGAGGLAGIFLVTGGCVAVATGLVDARSGTCPTGLEDEEAESILGMSPTSAMTYA